jgi:hypothetical protein
MVGFQAVDRGRLVIPHDGRPATGGERMMCLLAAVVLPLIPCQGGYLNGIDFEE